MRQLYLTKLILLIVIGAAATACSPSSAMATNVPTAVFVTDVPQTLEITAVSFTVISADEVAINACTTGSNGVGITMRVSVNTSNKGDGTGQWNVLKELGVPCFSPQDRPTWNTASLKPGTYLVKIEAKTADDPQWQHPATAKVLYTIPPR